MRQTPAIALVLARIQNGSHWLTMSSCILFRMEYNSTLEKSCDDSDGGRMLYLLTGNVQTGKTRWLEDEIARLAETGVTCYGVMAPGDWMPSSGEHADANGFEKRGIWNVLLPDGERIRFADRRDIAEDQGIFKVQSEAGKAGLGWYIHDDAIERVNDHLAGVPARVDEDGRRALLVIDELGRLELQHDGGLTEAVALMERGPQGALQDALVVVREELAPIAEERFAATWGGSTRIAPGDQIKLP